MVEYIEDIIGSIFVGFRLTVEAENKIGENKSKLKNSLTVSFITCFHKLKNE